MKVLFEFSCSIYDFDVVLLKNGGYARMSIIVYARKMLQRMVMFKRFSIVLPVRKIFKVENAHSFSTMCVYYDYFQYSKIVFLEFAAIEFTYKFYFKYFRL